jgi:hypothetical protein
MLLGGLMARLHFDYVVRPADPDREYAASRVAQQFGISIDEALQLMEHNDQLALHNARIAVAEGASISRDYH